MTDKGLWSSRVAGAMSHLAVLLFALCRLKAVERRREAVQQPLLLQSTLPLHHHVNNRNNNNNNNNIHTCIAPYGRNFRGAGPGSVLVGVRRGKRLSLREEKCL